MLGECQVNVKSQSELDIGGRETCFLLPVACTYEVMFVGSNINKARKPDDYFCIPKTIEPQKSCM